MSAANIKYSAAIRSRVVLERRFAALEGRVADLEGLNFGLRPDLWPDEPATPKRRPAKEARPA